MGGVDAVAPDANTSTHDDVAAGTAAGVDAAIADAEAQGVFAMPKRYSDLNENFITSSRRQCPMRWELTAKRHSESGHSDRRCRHH